MFYPSGTLVAPMSGQINKKEVTEVKTLIAVTALGLTLGFASLSSATDYMGLYTGAPAANEVKTETRGGEVESSPMSFYLAPAKTHIQHDSSKTAVRTKSDENTILVFSVRI